MIRAALQVRVDTFTLDVDVASGVPILVLFGPSGAGKSVTLQVIAGLLRPTSGELWLGDELLSGPGVHVPPHQRGFAYVPQHHALFPFHDVLGNVTFGLPRARRRLDDADVAAAMADVGITDLAHRTVSGLSGGERQRVALARALVVRPRLLLLDEPFASLDADARRTMGTVLRDLLQRRGVPALLVTHDVAEAVALGDAVLRFERGRTVGVVSPASLRRA